MIGPSETRFLELSVRISVLVEELRGEKGEESSGNRKGGRWCLHEIPRARLEKAKFGERDEAGESKEEIKGSLSETTIFNYEALGRWPVGQATKCS